MGSPFLKILWVDRENEIKRREKIIGEMGEIKRFMVIKPFGGEWFAFPNGWYFEIETSPAIF